MLAVAIRAANDPEKQPVAHCGFGRQIMGEEEHAFAGAAAHVNGGNTKLLHDRLNTGLPLLKRWSCRTRSQRIVTILLSNSLYSCVLHHFYSRDEVAVHAKTSRKSLATPLWNSLEVAKMSASIVTPVAIAFLGYAF